MTNSGRIISSGYLGNAIHSDGSVDVTNSGRIISRGEADGIDVVGGTITNEGRIAGYITCLAL